MSMETRKPLIVLCALLAAVFIFMTLANAIQHDFGKVDVSTFYIGTGGDGEEICVKLYQPANATAENPAAAVLLLHGYQNDKETSAAYAIELARRGIVALSIDEYGHGSTEIAMRERGYTLHKFTDALGNTKTVSGPERFLVMMNFSTLDFFYEEYSAGMVDSSMGGDAAYKFLESLNFVDANRIGITGHSMGTWASWSVAAHNPNHKAIVIQCGELFNETVYDAAKYKFNNVMLLQAKWDEFNYFRDYENIVSDELLASPLRYSDFAMQSSPIEWDTTYGSFADGTARRIQLLMTNHRLTTHDIGGMTASMDWFTEALGVNTEVAASNHTFQYKELLVLLSMLSALAAMFPALLLLMRLPFFAEIKQQRIGNDGRYLPKKKWLSTAFVSIAVGAVTYPFMTQLGHGLLPVPENIFRMTVGNGFMTWYVTLALVAIIILAIWRKKGKKRGDAFDFYDLGLSDKAHAEKLNWRLLGKSLLAAVILVVGMYGLVALCQLIFNLDLRYIWPFFKTFTLERFGQFFVYLPFFTLFFIVNVGCKLFGQMRRPFNEDKPVRSLISLWLKNVFVLVGGLLIIVLIEYIPFFLDLGPGADLLFSSTFGGPFMSALILIVPQLLVFTFMSTWFDRKTGSVYVGSFVSSMLAAWIVTGGSAIF